MLILWAAFCAVPTLAQTQQSSTDSAQSLGPEISLQPGPASISGTVVDPSGAAVGSARVRLRRDDPSVNQEMLSRSDGQFSFTSVDPGSFQLTVSASGFATQALSGTLHQGENYSASPIALTLAPEKTDVQVVVPRVEIAEEQIREEEKQRVLGFLPNFYVSYVPDAAPLTSKQNSSWPGK